MSDCNYCRWQRMKRTGKYKIANSKEAAAAWQAGNEFESTFGGGTVIIEKDTGRFVSWYMELPERCAC